MKAVQITMDPELLARLDAEQEVKVRGRSAVIREAVATWLRQREERRIVEAYRRAYENTGDLGDEWEGWEEQGSWPDDG